METIKMTQHATRSPASAGQGRANWVQGCVQDHPDTAVMVSLAAGVLTGVALSTLIEGRPPSTATGRASQLASDLGRRFLSSFDEVAHSSVSAIRDTLGR